MNNLAFGTITTEELKRKVLTLRAFSRSLYSIFIIIAIIFFIFPSILLLLLSVLSLISAGTFNIKEYIIGARLERRLII